MLDAMALLLPNMRIYLTGDSDVPSPVGVSVLVANHAVDGDWWALLMLTRCVGLRGSVKAFLQTNTVSTSGINENQSTEETNLSNQHLSISNSAQSLNGGFPNPNSNCPNGNSMIRNQSHQSVNGINAPSKAFLPAPPSPARSTSSSSPNSNETPNPKSKEPSLSQSQQMSVLKLFLHKLLDFPLLSSENNQNYIQDRNGLFSLLKSFACNGAPAPVHFLLFPEGSCWFGSKENTDPRVILAKSQDFARKEGRPILQHLLLPKTTGFYASLDSLREASPAVYDVTLAYRGYNGEIPSTLNAGMWLKVIRGEIPSEIHIRIKRYSMEEVLQDSNWLDKKWREKDRLLTHFVRHQQFPSWSSDQPQHTKTNRGSSKHWVLDTRGYCVENSIIAILRLALIPFAIPVILFLMIPILWCVVWIWIAHKSFLLLFPDGFASLWEGPGHGLSVSDKIGSGISGDNGHHSGSDSAVGTPFLPTTPFASPVNVTSWTSAATGDHKDGDSNLR
jgi:1-acyl-sn-glycerol-3-phosphate acyltransferase